MKHLWILAVVVLAMTSCQNKTTQKQNKTEEKTAVIVPTFNADSAYRYVAEQLSFGPRVPQSRAHTLCAEWLTQTLKHTADTLIEQDFKARIYNGKILQGKNIIASFNPEAKKRIVIAAHWDSRPFADHDPDSSNWHTPIDGANDGASGVGILIELSNVFHQNPLREGLGVDIILFDLEDYGVPAFDYGKYSNDSWTLGSTYWAKNPHRFGYQANLGILLDMVGAANPVFPKEYYSQQFAGWWSNKIWKKAREIGYSEYFTNTLGQPINDDHIPMNQIAGIPTVNIIHLVENSSNGSFYEAWHTLDDNLSQIDKNTLKIVGTVLTNVIYNE